MLKLMRCNGGILVRVAHSSQQQLHHTVFHHQRRFPMAACTYVHVYALCFLCIKAGRLSRVANVGASSFPYFYIATLFLKKY